MVVLNVVDTILIALKKKGPMTEDEIVDYILNVVEKKFRVLHEEKDKEAEIRRLLRILSTTDVVKKKGDKYVLNEDALFDVYRSVITKLSSEL